jgi:hypothetical protein
MASTATSPIVIVRNSPTERYGVPAYKLKEFSDGTALVMFAAGNLRIVHLELIAPASESEGRECFEM